MTRRLPEHLTRHQAVFLALLLLHAVFWLVISLIQPSLQVLLICLTSFATVLATMALLLSASEASGKHAAAVALRRLRRLERPRRGRQFRQRAVHVLRWHPPPGRTLTDPTETDGGTP